MTSSRKKEPATGRYQSTVVLGRRFCSVCGKWRHLIYFRPRRHRNGREYPQSPCDGCQNRRNKRDRKALRGHRRALRQEYEREYKERRRRQRGIPARWDYGPVKLDGKRAAEFFDEWITYEETWVTKNGKFGDMAIVKIPKINGYVAPHEVMEHIRHLRRGKIKTLDPVRADEICTRFELPLWELEQMAS